MKKITFISLLLFCILGCAQKMDSVTVKTIQLINQKYTLLVEKSGTLLYSGNFDTAHNLPIGTHFLYTKDGEIDKILEYEFSENKFEGVPETIQTTYSFKNGKIQFIKSAMRCTECEFEPIGIWKYYNENGDLIKEIDTSKPVNDNLEHPQFEYYWKYINKG